MFHKLSASLLTAINHLSTPKNPRKKEIQPKSPPLGRSTSPFGSPSTPTGLTYTPPKLARSAFLPGPTKYTTVPHLGGTYCASSPGLSSHGLSPVNQTPSHLLRSSDFKTGKALPFSSISKTYRGTPPGSPPIDYTTKHAHSTYVLREASPAAPFHAGGNAQIPSLGDLNKSSFALLSRGLPESLQHITSTGASLRR